MSKTEQTFQEKITALKKIYSRAHPDAINQISDWEDKYARFQARADWLQHPNTKELRDMAKEQVSIISSVLSEREDLSEIDRKTFFALKKAHLVYLAILTEDPSSSIKSIEQSVDAELINNENGN